MFVYSLPYVPAKWQDPDRLAGIDASDLGLSYDSFMEAVEGKLYDVAGYSQEQTAKRAR